MEPSEVRREVAAALGARAVDPAGDGLGPAVAELTKGSGGDVVFDAAGHYDTDGWTSLVPLNDAAGALGRLRRGQATKILVEVA
jgi:threonine dehydrogenase-like Zn-dependent dehydrogenase